MSLMERGQSDKVRMTNEPRAIEELRPTLLIDEADTLLPGNAQLRGILNAGYTLKMAYVLRVTNEPVQSSKFKVQSSKWRGKSPQKGKLAGPLCLFRTKGDRANR